MEICFIAGTLGRGGAERQLLYMLRVLKTEGIYTRVLCLTKGEDYERQIEDLGIEVEWVGASGNRVLRLIQIVNNIRKRPVDILQSSHFFTNIYAGVTGRLLRVPSIGAIRNDLTSEVAASGFWGRYQLQSPSHLVANSKLGLSRAEQFGVPTSKLHFVKNVTEVNPEQDYQRGTRCIRILFAGRLVRQKNPELFVRLAFRLKQELPDISIQFQMAGDGGLRPSLENLVEKCGFSAGEFVFSGLQSDMRRVYRNTDLLILTSDYEGTPNVVLEAMAFGIPVIATKAGGIGEVLEPECGMLVEPGDLAGLCSATVKLILDKRLRCRMGKSGREYVVANHSLPYLASRLAGIYSQLLEGGKLSEEKPTVPIQSKDQC